MEKDIQNITGRSRVSEKSLERQLVKRVKEMGGLCLKFASATETGYPDRLVLLPGGMACWVEVKSSGQVPTRFQEIRHDELRRRGMTVYVLDSREKLDRLEARWKEGRV